MVALKEGRQPLSIDDFLQNYFLRGHDRDKGRYNVYVRSKSSAPIVGLPRKDDSA